MFIQTMNTLRKNLHLYFLLFLILTTLILWYAVVRGAVGGGELVVAFLDVGQGDSVLTSVTQHVRQFCSLKVTTKLSVPSVARCL